MSIDRINSAAANHTGSADASIASKDAAEFKAVLNSVSSGNRISDLDRIFRTASGKYNVPENLLKAVAKAESGFNRTAESKCGAQGIMQLMPSTAKSLGVTDPFNAEQNIMGGAKYLSQMLERFDGNTELALAAYNAGPGNVSKYGGIPPFEETQNYVKKVMGYCGENITAGKAGMSERDAAGFSGTISSIEAWRLLQDIKLDIAAEPFTSEDIANELILNMYRNQLRLITDIDPSEEKNSF